MIRPLSLLCYLFFFGINLQAASVAKVKGKKVLINLDGTSLQKGDSFYGVDKGGSKKAILKVTAIKKNQAIAQVIKGKAEAGQTLVAYKGAATVAQDAALPEVVKSPFSQKGVLVSYLINKMSAKFTINSVEKTTDMSGNGFGVLGYYDHKMNPALQLRGAAGIEQFQVAESRQTMDCDKGKSTTCNAIINYLSMYGLAKYNVANGPTKFWLGGGGGYLFAISKASTVLDSSQITGNYVINASAGLDVNMTRGQYLPIIFEYSIFPSSSTVSASYIALRVGWGWR